VSWMVVSIPPRITRTPLMMTLGFRLR
jgi:hypothetical protein